MDPSRIKLPIRPKKLFTEGTKELSLKDLTIEKIEQLKAAGELKSPTKDSLVFQNGIVAFLDILGFSNKKDEDEIDRCFTDFPNPLIYAAKIFSKVRFNMFSDCAILAADQEDAADLIAAIRSSFEHWILDGILVRGGICLGTYVERTSVFYETAPPNFRGFIVSGSGVAKAAKLEAAKPAALLFIDDECAKFLKERFQEPIFCYGSYKAIGWSDDLFTLQWFMGISLVRALKLLSTKNKKFRDTIGKLFINVRHALEFDSGCYLYCLMLVNLSAQSTSPFARKVVCEVFHVKETHFSKLKPAIDAMLARKDRLRRLEALADSDSSMPSYVHIKDPLKD